VNYSHQNKDTSSHKQTSENEGCLEFNLQITFYNKHLNQVNILLTTDTIHLQYKFQINNCSVLIVHQVTVSVQFLLFIKSQFTTDAQNILDLNQCTPGHVCSWTTRRFQRSWGVCEWCDRHKKCVAAVAAHFQLELNTLACLSDPTDKNKGIYSCK